MIKLLIHACPLSGKVYIPLIFITTLGKSSTKSCSSSSGPAQYRIWMVTSRHSNDSSGAFLPRTELPSFFPWTSSSRSSPENVIFLAWSRQVLAWAKKEAEEQRTWRNLCGFYLAGNMRHRPIRSHHCQFRPIKVQVLPCEPSKRPVDFNKLGTAERF